MIFLKWWAIGGVFMAAFWIFALSKQKWRSNFEGGMFARLVVFLMGSAAFGMFAGFMWIVIAEVLMKR